MNNNNHRVTVVNCSCGNKIHCIAFTNHCSKCGTDYNFSGQQLAPRSQWGEETGETAGKIIMGTSYHEE